MPPPLQPEFFILLGLDLFLATSILSCLLDRHLPWQLPYMYQIAALAGYGQLIISQQFLTFFGEYMRFWYSFIYLIVAIANMVAIDVYLGFIKKLINYARIFTFTVTAPSLFITAFFLSNYAEIATHPLVMTPQLSWETTFVGIVAFDTIVVGLGTYVFFKPKWWYIGTGAGATIVGASIYALYKPTWGQAAFIVSAIGLAIACVLVLSVSIYVLAKIWKDTLKERRRKTGGETKK